jgi:hypothetical protein
MRAILVGILCSLAAVLCLRSPGACVVDRDVGWHLQTGAWIAQHHAVPRVDPFSRVTGGKPWQAYSWLFDLILLKMYGWMGLKGLVVFTAAMTALISGATYHLISRLQRDFLLCALLTLGVVISLSRLYTPRPWMFTIFFFAIEMDILMHAREKGGLRELLWLPPLFAVWANLHIQFVDGLLVLGVAACEPMLARWWKSEASRASARSLGLTLLACVAAASLNPYGPGIYKIAWRLGSQPGVLGMVTEMMSLPFRTLSDYLLLFLALAAAGVLFRYRRLAPFETLMLAMAAVLSFRSQRDLWMMSMTAAAILAAGLPGSAKQEERSMPVWCAALSALTAAGLLAAGPSLLGVDNMSLQQTLAENLPVQAVQVIQQRHYSGALFNDYGWGGFLIWQLREPVSIDGRAALYGDDRIRRSRDTWGGAADWASDPDLRTAGVVIGPTGAALTQLLRGDSQFELAWEDKVAAVFIARAGQKSANAGVADLSPPRH